MSEIQSSETVHERRITWSLMATVVVFVLLMSCIVLWVMMSLIREERAQTGLPTPTGATASTTPEMLTSTPTVTPTEPATLTPTTEPEITIGPVVGDPTWTPVPGPKRYVRFSYWKVVPNKIKLGECIQLTWETEFAASLKLYRNGKLLVDQAPASTTLHDCPDELGYAVYRLVAWNKAGESNWVQLQVKVVAP
jgi:cytoskeletal protein RodZ